MAKKGPLRKNRPRHGLSAASLTRVINRIVVFSDADKAWDNVGRGHPVLLKPKKRAAKSR